MVSFTEHTFQTISPFLSMWVHRWNVISEIHRCRSGLNLCTCNGFPNPPDHTQLRKVCIWRLLFRPFIFYWTIFCIHLLRRCSQQQDTLGKRAEFYFSIFWIDICQSNLDRSDKQLCIRWPQLRFLINQVECSGRYHYQNSSSDKRSIELLS